MKDLLEPLLADGVIDEVVARLKGGKEADVWLVRHAGEIVAAKVYRSRATRSFKNDAAYREGRQVRNSRTQRAMDRGSRFGRAAAEDDWKTRESDALHRLHAAGVRVPRPVMFYEGVLLMEVVVDAHGHPAPRLVDAPLAPEQAAGLYRDLRRQVVTMLTCDLIHGDLSPFNVLVGCNGPVVIDFPQAIDAAQNQQAEKFLLRDLQNLHRYCASLDPSLQASAGDGAEIWQAYVRRELNRDFVPTGRGVQRQAPRAQRGGRPDAPRADSGPPAHPGQRHPPAPHHGARGQGGHAGQGGSSAHAAQASHPAHQASHPAHQGGHGGQRGHGAPGGQGKRGGGERPHGLAQPQGGRPQQVPPSGPRRQDPRGRPMPEVIRLQRLPRDPTASGGAQGGQAGGKVAGGTPGAGAGRRHRRRRR